MSEQGSDCVSIRTSKFAEDDPRLLDKMLVVGKKSLSRKELLNLRGNGAISANLMDTMMEIIKGVNSEMIRSKESHDRVLVLSTEFSGNVFASNNPPRAETNVLKYE